MDKIYKIARETIRGPIRDLMLSDREPDQLRPMISDIMTQAIRHPVRCEPFYNTEADIRVGGYICLATDPSIDISKKSIDWQKLIFFTGPKSILKADWPYDYRASSFGPEHDSSRFDCGCARCVRSRNEVKIWTNLTQRYNRMQKLFAWETGNS